MTIDVNSAIGQAQNIYNSLAKYFSDMTTYHSSGGACPDFNSYIGSIDYSELHRLTMLGQTDSANFPNGIAIESIHHITSVLREFVIRTKGKSEYYTDGQADAVNESNYYSTLQTYAVSTLSGNVTPGGSM